ncbi:fam-c protein [Plasmodium yoelii]|uniref:Fam-c protein n=2 Tax=Plasmodium yoelii TaxID=5861 RepID=A0AAE9WYP9_PLAYO|nr:fam-c protein [Plasmodium yoelii]WBY58999.1 fam-c protein [Plasmodium yoelii yoelii]CDU19193.1 fam-c protein [Plasmodium yoelii]VTZ79828.1 fam-c protein [Plasmodium yoelii]|eukprot:XP_725594.2 fam-c protein [Plasmodium yoelii]
MNKIIFSLVCIVIYALLVVPIHCSEQRVYYGVGNKCTRSTRQRYRRNEQNEIEFKCETQLRNDNNCNPKDDKDDIDDKNDKDDIADKNDKDDIDDKNDKDDIDDKDDKDDIDDKNDKDDIDDKNDKDDIDDKNDKDNIADKNDKDDIDDKNDKDNIADKDDIDDKDDKDDKGFNCFNIFKMYRINKRSNASSNSKVPLDRPFCQITVTYSDSNESLPKITSRFGTYQREFTPKNQEHLEKILKLKASLEKQSSKSKKSK